VNAPFGLEFSKKPLQLASSQRRQHLGQISEPAALFLVLSDVFDQQFFVGFAVEAFSSGIDALLV